MLWVNVSALSIRRLSGRFNFFHMLAVLSLVMVAGGVTQVVFRRRIRRWLWRHYHYMCWSYAGLIAAGLNEAFTRVPALRELSAATGGWLVVAGSAVVIGSAGILVFANQGRLLRALDDVPPAST
jgi:hypothetical protein